MTVGVWAGDSGSVIELERLEGPRTGRIELPRYLFPDVPDTVIIDLDEPQHKARLYTACLRRGSPYDVYRYVNLTDLAVLLPTLPLPKPIADAWFHALHEAQPVQ